MSTRSKLATQSINSLVAKLGVLSHVRLMPSDCPVSKHVQTLQRCGVPCLAVSYSAQIPTTDMG